MVPVRRHGEASVATAAAGIVVERRGHRSRRPTGFSIVGFVLGALVADVVILSLLGDSLVAGLRPEGAWSDPVSWWGALVAFSDPGIALASVALGGFPGAILGRTLAIRRLRSDRLDALLSPEMRQG